VNAVAPIAGFDDPFAAGSLAGDQADVMIPHDNGTDLCARRAAVAPPVRRDVEFRTAALQRPHVPTAPLRRTGAKAAGIRAGIGAVGRALWPLAGHTVRRLQARQGPGLAGFNQLGLALDGATSTATWFGNGDFGAPLIRPPVRTLVRTPGHPAFWGFSQSWGGADETKRCNGNTRNITHNNNLRLEDLRLEDDYVAPATDKPTSQQATGINNSYVENAGNHRNWLHWIENRSRDLGAASS
jgi:hypothetical protein